LDTFLISKYVFFKALHFSEWIYREKSIFDCCLEAILNPLETNQGVSKPIYANVCFGDKVALC